MRRLRLALGRYRLLFGFCPLCNSSPPKPRCLVCFGDPRYGREADRYKRNVWWRNYRRLLGG